MSNYINTVSILNNDTNQNIKLSTNGNTLNLDYSKLMTTLGSYLTTSVASLTYQTITNMSNYLTTTVASSIYQTVANMSSYLTTSVASTTYQTLLNVYVSTGSTGYSRFPFLTTRPGVSGQYIGTLGWPSGSLFSAIISASTPDIINSVSYTHLTLPTKRIV